MSGDGNLFQAHHEVLTKMGGSPESNSESKNDGCLEEYPNRTERNIGGDDESNCMKNSVGEEDVRKG